MTGTAVHALGNGRLLVYGCGADITHVFGPGYSTASLLAATWHIETNSQFTGPHHTVSHREGGAGIWHHTITNDAHERLATIGTAVDTNSDVLAIDVSCAVGLRLKLRPTRPGAWRLDREGHRATLLTEPGAAVFIYPDPATPTATVVADQACRLSQDLDRVVIDLPPGEHDLHLTVAARPGSGDQSDQSDTNDEIFARRRAADHLVTAPLAELEGPWGSAAPWGRRAFDRLEGAVLNLLAQQSGDGGIMAGYPYPLAYGRDQYGACRGLSALGYFRQSAGNFWFRHTKLRHFGRLANAESMGHDLVRHIHENDAVELTSYHVLHATELAEQAADFDIQPVLEELLECLRMQLEFIRLDTLPFNGDETYVAGGILPRTVLEDGSLESTLLFAEAARRLHPLFARMIGSSGGDVWAAAERIEAAWRRQFPRRAGRGLTVNLPSRRLLQPVRDSRPGVCECCGSIGADAKHRTTSGRYVCQRCLDNGTGDLLGQAGMERYNILSATLLPYLINRSLLTDSEDNQLRREVVTGLRKTGELRTAPQVPKSVGYDAALLVLATASGPVSDRYLAVNHLLQHFDDADTLAEYYQNGRPTGTRCRPWETGVALCSLVAAVDGAAKNGRCD